MKSMKLVLPALLISLAIPMSAWAEGARSWQLHNRLRVEYDDNIYEEESDKTDSLVVRNEVEFVVRFDLENTYVGVRYKPSLAWWENRSEDSTDFHHELDVRSEVLARCARSEPHTARLPTFASLRSAHRRRGSPRTPRPFSPPGAA